MGEEQANRQLLVALHVLTKGLPFEKIVLNEYESVRPEQARRLLSGHRNHEPIRHPSAGRNNFSRLGYTFSRIRAEVSSSR